jgi:hypothetical protein
VLRIIAALIIAMAAIAEPAYGLPNADEKPATDAAQPAAAEAMAAEKEIRIEERLPPGFKVKKRGKFTLFCKTDTPLGTRFKSETCYDEPNMRAYMLALQENKSDVDRIRSICSNPCACGQPDAC